MGKQMEALERIKALDKTYITAAQAAPVMGRDPHWIRLRAREDPKSFSFDVETYGKCQVRIHRISFIKAMEGA